MFKNHSLLFFKKFIHNPKYVGSVVPSSRFLANRMVEAAEWEQAGNIVEIGSGTGAITRVIAERARPESKVILFEKEEEMGERLQQDFPQFIRESNALRLVAQLKKHNVQEVDYIFSGLPFYNFSPIMRLQLVQQCQEALKPGGKLIAFQYSLQMRKLFAEHFEIERISAVPLNIPPAFVYVCRKANHKFHHSRRE
ncbi:class I SAM-dependent methyltransferase [Cohnella thailandensis]|uniref:Methyltransferase domain-containing protein n=1 Tax=Cohnella thailandensis TaxID=557557 RepID=A0A841SR76_9BACL|nr:methyltransferase domain-containing protein [Cohnella thailandensis]MBB6633409.1 methyltransferase domain-containing protein [Cohnella thailandensis]MBP1977248.1 phospholipid N-methyltransferase [Cohnella thailandensis]